MSAAHTVKAFDDDLDQLRAAISEMGGLAEAAISGSMRALVQRDTEAALRIVEEDHKIDALEAEIEKQAVQIIALRAPMADDLRDVIAALKIAGVGRTDRRLREEHRQAGPRDRGIAEYRAAFPAPRNGAHRRRDGSQRS
jgi:phosphate uptake regulator